MSNSLVWIVLLNYNGYKDTKECLESLEKITYQNYKILVVDNKSTDNSVELLNDLQEKHDFELLCREINDGFSTGNNEGIRFAIKNGADYILLLNNDTLVEEDFVEKLVSEFRYHNDCWMTISKIFYNDDRNRIWYAGGSISNIVGKTRHFHYDERNQILNENVMKVTFATGCCFCLSREAIMNTGLLDEDYFLYEEDADYCYKLQAKGGSIYYVPESIIYHKVSASAGQSSSLSQYYLVRNKFLFIKKNIKIKYRLIAYLYNIVMFLFRIFKGDISVRYFVIGFCDFLCGYIGKSQRKL